ncbi:MAG: sensor histidine kinase [Balneola sp.]|nr:MAG: sensor histidine kinase [Balneola sp.]
MNIQTKLAAVYIVLLSIGVVVISSYAILSIRSFLLEETIQKFESDANTLAQSLESKPSISEVVVQVNFMSELTGYEIALFDSLGTVLVSASNNVSGFTDSREFLTDSLKSILDETEDQVIINEEELENLISFHSFAENDFEARYLRISQNKDDLYAAEASIRHLIYGAMIGSILVVFFVSLLFARYLAKPIKQLNDAALDIAAGDLDRELHLEREDEFGMLADSLNQMAGTLKADNEKLKLLNEKQNQFFADITHEVRNPLHTISGALEMLQMPSLDEPKKNQYLGTAQKQVERVVRLFEDIKSLQRYDYDESYIQKSVFNINQLIKEVSKTYSLIAKEKGIELSTKMDTGISVLADRDKIEQVLDNLVSNAVKYTNEGEITIELVKLNNELGKISVKDTGIGIDQKHLDRLFDRFYRTDKARSRDKGGTGLGLAVVKGILNAHQKDIFVDSTSGEGSTFYFYLDVTEE